MVCSATTSVVTDFTWWATFSAGKISAASSAAFTRSVEGGGGQSIFGATSDCSASDLKVALSTAALATPQACSRLSRLLIREGVAFFGRGSVSKPFVGGGRTPLATKQAHYYFKLSSNNFVKFSKSFFLSLSLSNMSMLAVT